MSESKSGTQAFDSVEDATAAFRELREYAQGNLDVEHRDVHRITGLIDDDEVREVLMFMAESYDHTRHPDLPRSFWDTQFARRAVRKYASVLASQAVRDGNLTQVSYITGAPSYKSDVSGLHAISQLEHWLCHSEQCKLIYLAALMGRGKTDLSLTFLEVINHHYQRLQATAGADVEIVQPEFAANFHIDPNDDDVDVRTISTERELLEWAETGSSADERWFIFDEASTELTAQSGKNAQKVAETMGPFVKKMRKLGINMVVIGHDKGDVHVAIRSMADFVDKTGLKTASFYAGINNREPQGHLFDLDGIPPTSWTFDTDDMAEWTWIADEDGVDEQEDVGMTEQEFKHAIEERGAILHHTIDHLTLREVANTLSQHDDGVEVSTAGINRGKKRLGLDNQQARSRAEA